MTVTFDATLSDDESIVRFHVGDTNIKGAYLQDETITALLTSEGSVGAASIACIRFIITQLSSPDFKKDWLSVSNKEARMGFEQLMKDKANEFGITLARGISMSSSVSNVSRADSYQDSNDYDGSP